MTTAIVSALGALGGIFAGQGRSGGAPPAAPVPRVDTSTQAIALARDGATARAAARNADKERLYSLLTDPQVLGVACALGGTLLAANMQFHANRTVNGQLRGLTAGSCMLMGLGRAGVGDMTSLSVAALTAGVLGMAGLAEDIGDSGSGSGSGSPSAWDQFWSGLVNIAQVPPMTI